jgi:hypothetical protein
VKKSDVQLSYHQGHSGDPMVNVKHHLWIPDLIRKYKGTGVHEFSDDAEFWRWLEETYEESSSYGLDEFQTADEWARESCWDLATEYAHEIWPQYSTEMVDEKAWFPEFPPGCQHRFTGNKVPRKRYHVQVYSAGRSGGWLVVSGLPDVESWDAIALGRWVKFEEEVRAIADEGYPYDFIWQLRVNVYEPVHIKSVREHLPA